MQASESVISDADMAEEMTAYTRNSILARSATAILAQADMISRVLLQLLPA